MSKIFTKSLFFLVLITALSYSAVFAQSITIGNVVNTGSYGNGSTIAVPFHINDASGCVQQNNVYSLYLCNSAGVVVAGAPVDTIKNFYGNFFNFTVPAGLAPGSYTFKVTASSPVLTSTISNVFAVSAGTGPVVSVNCTSPVSTISNPKYPDVFGTCSGEPNTTYTFTNATASGSAVTASFFNETSQTTVKSNQALAPAYNFVADTTNYTVTVTAVNAAGVISTHDYKLINNVVNTSIGSTGSLNVCLSNGSAPLTYNIDVSSTTGIEYNYPGNVYIFKWGDGTTSTYTLCQIEALKGQITHNYASSSCGDNPSNHPNAFEIDFESENIYCGQIGSAPSNFAKVLNEPVNSFVGPVTACTNVAVTFTNSSVAGPDPNASTASCTNNPNAVYSWSVQQGSGPVQVIQTGLHNTQPFVYTFPTHGTYTVTVHLQNPPTGSSCIPADYSQTICIQDPPKPSFTLTAAQKLICTGNGPVVPTNTSVIDASCNTNNQYNWTVTPSTGVTFTATDAQPDFVFSQSGVYQVALNITTASCGNTYTTAPQTIVVNSSPTATLSADFSACGKGQTFVFDNNNPSTNKTYTVLTGTAQATASTYNWTVTSAAGGTYSFAMGSSASSQYPSIIFNSYDTYTVTVTQTNNCGTATASQKITFEQAPTVSAGTDFTICAGAPANLQGTTTGSGVISYKWTGGNGTYTPSANVLQPSYQPTAAEIAAGQVTLTFVATTSIAAPCNTISSSVTVTITPTDLITNALTKTICSKTNVGYTATALDAGSTFTWTASVTSGQASGFTTSGTGASINDQLVNTDATATINAVVSYTITPTSANGCPGTPSTLQVTVTPLPIIKATPGAPSICSGQPANIALSSSITGPSYTWTSTHTGTVTGNTTQSTAITNTSIQDVLVNNGTTAATVTYTITPISSNGCSGSAAIASVIVEPAPVTSNAGSSTSICNTTSYQLQGNSPGAGTGLWTVVSGSGTTFTDATSPTTTVNGLVGGNQYTFMWTITSAPGCTSSSQVTIMVNVPTVPGTTAAAEPTTVCSGNNSGQITLTGQTGVVLEWESSVDGGTTWVTAQTGNTASITFLNLTQTTAYRAEVQNGSCDPLYSTVTTITVSQAAITANAGGPYPPLCNGLTLTLNGNDPGTLSGTWTQISGPPVIFNNPANPQTTVSGLTGGNVYDLRWTIHAVTPCSDSYDDAIITDKANVVPGFTSSQTNACGPTTITFTNTSNDISTASFLWDFGDGQTSTTASPQHQFQPSTNGTDATYLVTLNVVDNCSPQPAATATITISPANPVVSISPQQLSLCGASTLTVSNTSPGTNASYMYYLIDGLGNNVVAPITKPDKSDVTFSIPSPSASTTYYVYMVATNNCGNTSSTTHLPITVSPADITPQIFAGGPLTGCAPYSTSFTNNSTGGTSFYYAITNTADGSVEKVPTNAGTQPYTFSTAGTYTVQLIASDACTPGIASSILTYTIYPVPQPSFTYTTDFDNVTFTNTTPDNGSIPASSLSYTWNFGDGSPLDYNFTPATHSYNYENSPFTVTLTAVDLAGQCPSTTTQTITILGHLFLPNAFMPASPVADLRVFIAKGSGLKTWLLQIFNNYGQLVWETTRLDSNGSPVDGWDGTFKGAPAPQGAYYWQASATFINGTKWKGMSYNGSLPKTTGTVNLIR